MKKTVDHLILLFWIWTFHECHPTLWLLRKPLVQWHELIPSQAFQLSLLKLEKKHQNNKFQTLIRLVFSSNKIWQLDSGIRPLAKQLRHTYIMIAYEHCVAWWYELIKNEIKQGSRNTLGKLMASLIIQPTQDHVQLGRKEQQIRMHWHTKIRYQAIQDFGFLALDGDFMS